MNPSVPEHKVERIVVAFDASQQGQALLRTAVQMAAQLQAELQGIFVEDANLLRLCSLPFSQDVGRFSATTRPLDSAAVERQFRAAAVGLEQTLAQAAAAAQVTYSFRVTRGSLADELLAAAQDAYLVSLARAVDHWCNAVDTTAEKVLQQAGRPVLVLGQREGVSEPFTIVYSGSAAAQRALNLTLRLARRGRCAVQVIFPSTLADMAAARADLAAKFANQGLQAHFAASHDRPELAQRLWAIRAGAIILPVEYADLVARLHGPVIVMP